MLKALCVSVIGASEASPYLVFNVAILSVCMYLYVMDRHNDLVLGLMILADFHRCNFVCMYPYVMDRHNDLLLGLMILTDFHVDSS